tara:strand:+ start:79760 stop:81676 length:1917 start_codon:yes stop_codon:yes gene_type:complete
MEVLKMNKNLFLWIGIAVAMVFLFKSFSGADKQTSAEVGYTTFLEQVEKKQVVEAVIENGTGEIIYLLNSGKRQRTRIIGGYDSDLINDLRQHGVKAKAVAAEQEGGLMSVVFNVIIFAAIFMGIMFIMRRMQGGGGGGAGAGGMSKFSKSKAQYCPPGENTLRFSDVAGCDEAKFEVQELVEYMRNPEAYQDLGVNIPTGLLMLGPPGTGKTLLAKALAGEAQVPFFTLAGSDFVEMFVGVGASRMRDTFEMAKKVANEQNTGVIIFIDEIDAIGKKRSEGMQSNDEREGTLNAMLVEMDGFKNSNQIIVIGATNRADVLDPALLRPGRFTRKVTVGKPDVAGREKILELYGNKVPMSKDVDFKKIAQSTPGMTGAELENVINEAGTFAAREKRKEITMADLEAAVEKVFMGPERKSMLLSDAQRAETAMHEAGHCVAGYVLSTMGFHDAPYMVSIVPREQALGVTIFRNGEDNVSQNKGQLMAFALTLLAGRIGEWVHHNQDELKITTGASSDLERASSVIRAMIKDVGLSKELGPITAKSNAYGQSTASATLLSQVDKISKDWLDAADLIVRDFIMKHKKELCDMTELLMEKGTIRDADIKACLGHLDAEYQNVKFGDIFDIEARANQEKAKKSA